MFRPLLRSPSGEFHKIFTIRVCRLYRVQVKKGGANLATGREGP
jgi:hypothetical protein